MPQFNRRGGWLEGGVIALIFVAFALPPVIQQTSQAQSSQREVSQRQQTIVGTILTSFDQKGQQHQLKIESVSLDSQDSEREISLYTVLYQHTDGGWRNLCQPDLAGGAKAIPLSGRWDETGSYVDDGSLTFACTNGAIAKCVRWGYKPWKTIEGESLRDYHQACTRMVRADSCGNGNSHTQAGTPIDVYDHLGLQQRSHQSGMVFEAAWGIDGVLQLNRPRFQAAIAQLQKECPEKIASAQQSPVQNHLQQNTPAVGDSRPLLFNDSFIPTRSDSKRFVSNNLSRTTH